jgi:hypothetical protein
LGDEEQRIQAVTDQRHRVFGYGFSYPSVISGKLAVVEDTLCAVDNGECKSAGLAPYLIALPPSLQGEGNPEAELAHQFCPAWLRKTSTVSKVINVLSPM